LFQTLTHLRTVQCTSAHKVHVTSPCRDSIHKAPSVIVAQAHVLGDQARQACALHLSTSGGRPNAATRGPAPVGGIAVRSLPFPASSSSGLTVNKLTKTPRNGHKYRLCRVQERPPDAARASIREKARSPGNCCLYAWANALLSVYVPKENGYRTFEETQYNKKKNDK
jgi:hypothetical protein